MRRLGQQPSGMGVGGPPRKGRPKSYGERLREHRLRFPYGVPPARGTGVQRRGLIPGM